MTKKHFIRLADYLSEQGSVNYCEPFTDRQLAHIANFCHESNPSFNRDRWLGYIRGTNGPSGGAIPLT